MIFLLLGITGLIAFSGFVIYIKTQADPKYDKKKLNTLEISRIYDMNGKEIAKLGSEKREKVSYNELPEVLVDAIIATEDSRFFQHNGLDAPRFLKATIGQLTHGSGAGGAGKENTGLYRRRLRNTGVHHHYGKRRGHTQRQHYAHKSRPVLWPQRPAPASRQGGAQQREGILLSDSSLAGHSL